MCQLLIRSVYFNPRSRVGNDEPDCIKLPETLISIHVPAWGTTKSKLIGGVFGVISIHVPAWGTTTTTITRTVKYDPFQSTFPRGERPISFISFSRSTNFNPRSRVGNDGNTIKDSVYAQIFQSTFPRGERPDLYDLTPVGVYISIHVPAWGTTIHVITYIQL